MVIELRAKDNTLCVFTGSFAEAAEDTAVVRSFVEGTSFSSLFSCKHAGEIEGERAKSVG